MKGPAILALDVGGAHLKAALIEGGRLARIAVEPCPLWRGMGELDAALDRALAGWDEGETRPRAQAETAITMTAELVDLFPDRASGVGRLVGHLTARFGAERTAFFAGRHGFLASTEAAKNPAAIASANWLATAQWLAGRLDAGLLVDIGSTTTDLVPFTGGLVTARGGGDAERLAEGELVYTGAARTPVMAMARLVPFAGRSVPLMAEFFANAADVHRLAGGLPESADLHGTPDGADRSAAASARRLLRMIGEDFAPDRLDAARDLARHLAASQLDTIAEAARRVLWAGGGGETIVGAGVGRFIACRLAERLGLAYRDIGEMLTRDEALKAGAADAAPAACLGLVAQHADIFAS